MSKMDEEEPDPEAATVESETGEADVDAEEQFPMAWDEPAGNRKESEDREHISQFVEKYDARKIVTGEAKYTADFRDRVPDLAEAKVLRSEIAHGHVKTIDTSEAEAMDGVYAVITPWSDVVPDQVYTSAGQSYPEPTPWDLTVLRKKVRMVGDPIAAVAAEDRETADRARRKIHVEYEELDPVLDMEAATDPDAPQLFEEGFVENRQPGADYSRNLESSFEGELGDVESAFEDADTVHETEWETPYQNHCVPEP
ncbi:MAG: CO/xanthine dehydrogenase Mo-binding subunit, partial [Halobacteriales archaeon]